MLYSSYNKRRRVMCNNKDTKYIDLDFLSLHLNKKMLCYGDFYKECGVADVLKSLTNESKSFKYHYANIQANTETLEKIEKILLDNLLHTKNKYSRAFKEQYLKTMAAMDNLCYSPKSNDNLEDDVIMVLLPNNPHYIKIAE